MQARFVARVLSGRVQLPPRSQMHTRVQDFYDLLQQAQVPVRYTHSQVRGGGLCLTVPQCTATGWWGRAAHNVAAGLSQGL